MASNSTNNITNTKAPALIVPTRKYSPDPFNLQNNQLRLYFNTLDAANGQTIQQINNLVTNIWLGI
jgi:hypothetical protein